MLVLASQSAGRRALLANAGVPHEAVTAEIDEDAARTVLKAGGLGATELACALAELKALDVSAKRPEEFVIGCDQILELDDGTMLDKAADRQALAGQLQSLSGRTHSLHSGIVVARNRTVIWQDCERASMKMRPLSASFIEHYIDEEGEGLLGCVGGYRIEGRGAQLFSSVEGSHFAIIGLPLMPLLAWLRSQGVMGS